MRSARRGAVWPLSTPKATNGTGEISFFFLEKGTFNLVIAHKYSLPSM